MWNNSGRNIKLDQVDFIDVGPRSGDSRLNIEADTIFKWCQKFGEKCWSIFKWWAIEKELEMPDMKFWKEI